MDGRYNLLILDVCNPKNSSIKSKKSLVMHPNGSISNRLLMQELVQLELFIPNSGYFDSYFLEEELKKLEESKINPIQKNL
jgi:hypothetical protein